jgi:hypothetical protein
LFKDAHSLAQVDKGRRHDQPISRAGIVSLGVSLDEANSLFNEDRLAASEYDQAQPWQGGSEEGPCKAP